MRGNRGGRIGSGIAIGFALGFATTLVYWFPEEPAVASCGGANCAAVGYTALVTAAVIVGLLAGAMGGFVVHAITKAPPIDDDSTLADASSTHLHVAVRNIGIVPARGPSSVP